VHAPVRLAVFIAAPEEAINQVIARHELVRQLVDHRWLHLFMMREGQTVFSRYAGQYQWDGG
jgi:uncharacterized protein YbcC (UPF0753/DUF2309 family)